MAISVLPISAQEQRIKEPEKISFKPHWFIQAQIGAAHTVGEAKFTDLISPAAALNVGYKFAPAFGARVGVSGWQAKGGWVNPQQTYQYKYLQGNVDIMADLSTLFCGFNPKRVFNGYLFAGAGLNRGFDNDEANALDTRTYEMEYLWQEGKFLVAGRFGLGCDLRLNDRLSINIEANANALSDKFNSKKAGNCDWQLNALVGVSIRLGKSYTKTAPVYYEPEPVVTEQPKPIPVAEKPQPKKEVCKALQDGFQQDAVCAGRNYLGCGNHTDVVLLEQHLISGAVVTVAGKAVEFPDDDHIEQVLVAVLNHLLKRRAMVCPRGISAVDVVLQNRDVVLLRESHTLADLSFDGFLALVVGRIAGVDNGFHQYRLLMYE